MRSALKVAAVAFAGALALAACGSSSSGGGSPTSAAPGGSTTPSASKSSIKVGLAYDIGGRGDKSFNDSAAAGLDKAKTRASASRPRSSPPSPARPTRSKQDAADRCSPGRATTRSSRSASPTPARSKTVAAEVPGHQLRDHRRRELDRSRNVANAGLRREAGLLPRRRRRGAEAAKTGNDRLHRRRQRAADPEVPGRLRRRAPRRSTRRSRSQVKYLTQPPDFSGFNDPAKGQTVGAGHVRRRRRHRLRGGRRLRRRRLRGGQGRRQAGHRRRLRPVPDGRRRPCRPSS